MVSVVLHNACLRMEEEGADLDEILAPKGIQRWLSKGGLALGGAASLLVGAVFGGILESVPVLLPPPAAAAATPSIVNGLPVSSVLTQVADAVPAPAAPVVAAVAAAVASAPTGGLVSVPKVPTGGGIVNTTGPGGSTSTPILGGGSTGGTNTGGTAPTAPTPSAPSPLAPVVTAVQPVVTAVQPVLQPVVTAVQPVLQPVVTAVQPVVQATAPVTSSTGIGSTLTTVTNTLGL
jgi:hypothetical protein